MELISREDVMRLVESGKLLSGSFGERARDIIKALPTIEERKEGKWVPLHFDGALTDYPYERDGAWVIVTDGKCVSVERIKKGAYDHFCPRGRWFEIKDAIAWMPLPLPPKETGDDL